MEAEQSSDLQSLHLFNKLVVAQHLHRIHLNVEDNGILEFFTVNNTQMVERQFIDFQLYALLAKTKELDKQIYNFC